eukprot:4827371-Prymnesium_polylepis.1
MLRQHIENTHPDGMCNNKISLLDRKCILVELGHSQLAWNVKIAVRPGCGGAGAASAGAATGGLGLACCVTRDLVTRDEFFMCGSGGGGAGGGGGSGEYFQVA